MTIPHKKPALLDDDLFVSEEVFDNLFYLRDPEQHTSGNNMAIGGHRNLEAKKGELYYAWVAYDRNSKQFTVYLYEHSGREYKGKPIPFYVGWKHYRIGNYHAKATPEKAALLEPDPEGYALFALVADVLAYDDLV